MKNIILTVTIVAGFLAVLFLTTDRPIHRLPSCQPECQPLLPIPAAVPEPAPPAPPATIPNMRAKRWTKRYEGDWVTTANLKLKGTMTAEVTRHVDDKWTGRFFGLWNGRNFSYNIEWTSTEDILPESKVQGKARIDGASYDWKGEISDLKFKGTFTGTRYTGYFDLKSK